MIQDGSGKGNNIDVHEGGGLDDGVTNCGATSNASTRYHIPTSSSLQILSQMMTIEVWIKLDTLPSTGNDVVILGSDSQFALFYRQGHGFCFNYYPYSKELCHDVTPTTGAWNHLAVTRDGNGVTIFYNGNVGGTLVDTWSSGQTNTNGIYVMGTDPARRVTGTIDNLRFWSVTRSQTQICTDAGLSCTYEAPSQAPSIAPSMAPSDSPTSTPIYTIQATAPTNSGTSVYAMESIPMTHNNINDWWTNTGGTDGKAGGLAASNGGKITFTILYKSSQLYLALVINGQNGNTGEVKCYFTGITESEVALKEQENYDYVTTNTNNEVEAFFKLVVANGIDTLVLGPFDPNTSKTISVKFDPAPDPAPYATVKLEGNSGSTTFNYMANQPYSFEI